MSTGVKIFSKVVIMEKDIEKNTNIFYEPTRDRDENIYYCLARNTQAAPHYHRSIELIFVFDGSFVIQINGIYFQSERGDIFFIPPYCHHSITRGSSSSLTLILPETYLNYYYKIFEGKYLPSKLSDKEWNLNNAFPEAERLCRPRNNLIVVGVSNTLLGLLYEHYPIKEHTLPKNEFIAKTVHYLWTNYDKEIKIQTLADYTGYSKYHFSKLFNNYMGCSFEFYLETLRVQKFAELLKPDSNITELALACGFGSISTFYRHFKKIYGITPLAMQKQK